MEEEAQEPNDDDNDLPVVHFCFVRGQPCSEAREPTRYHSRYLKTVTSRIFPPRVRGVMPIAAGKHFIPHITLSLSPKCPRDPIVRLPHSTTTNSAKARRPSRRLAPNPMGPCQTGVSNGFDSTSYTHPALR